MLGSLLAGLDKKFFDVYLVINVHFKNNKALRHARPRCYLAEREGFEPSLGLTLNTLSRRAPSATQPPLQIFYQERFCFEIP